MEHGLWEGWENVPGVTVRTSQLNREGPVCPEWIEERLPAAFGSSSQDVPGVGSGSSSAPTVTQTPHEAMMMETTPASVQRTRSRPDHSRLRKSKDKHHGH